MKNINKKLMFTSFIGGMIVFILLSLNMIVSAAPANPSPIEVEQADGTSITIFNRGDEFLDWMEDENGNVIAYDDINENWCYAYISDSKIVPGVAKVGNDSQLFSKTANKITSADLKPLIEQSPRYTRNFISGTRTELFNETALSSTVNEITTNQKILLVLLEFNNQSLVKDETYWYNEYFNATADAKSVVNYYKDMSGGYTIFEPATLLTNSITTQKTVTASYGRFSNISVTIYPSTRAGIVKVRLNMAHPIQRWGNSFFNEDALDIATDTVSLALRAIMDNYTGFNLNAHGDNLHPSFVFSGRERSNGDNVNINNQVWAHASGLGALFSQSYMCYGEMFNASNPMGIGVVCHELGHTLGLPDLYDYTGVSNGIGVYSLMASGSWGYTSSETISGRTPTALDAWSKIKLGYVTPTVIPTTEHRKADIKSLNTNNYSDYNVLKLTSSVNLKQYLLVENRQYSSWDKGMYYSISSPTGGIVIYHVNESVWDNDNWQRRMVNVVGMAQSNANTSLFYAANVPNTTSPRNLLHDTTNPNSRFYRSDASNLRDVDSGIVLRVNSNNGASMEVEVGNGIVLTLPNLVFNTSNMFTFSQIKFITTSGYYSKTVYYVLKRSGTQIASGSTAINATGNATLTITQQQFSANEHIEILIYGDSAYQSLITRQIVRPTLFQF